MQIEISSSGLEVAVESPARSKWNVGDRVVPIRTKGMTVPLFVDRVSEIVGIEPERLWLMPLAWRDRGINPFPCNPKVCRHADLGD